MHSVCFYLKRQDKSVVRASCLQYVPKPVVKVIRKSTTGNEFTTTMSFIDCINWINENGLRGKMDLSKVGHPNPTHLLKPLCKYCIRSCI